MGVEVPGEGHLLPDKDGSESSHFRVWGKPIYAMANGVVKGFSNEVRLNPKKRVSRAKIEQNGNPTSTAARGNLVYLDGYTQKGQPRLSGIWYKTVPYAPIGRNIISRRGPTKMNIPLI